MALEHPTAAPLFRARLRRRMMTRGPSVAMRRIIEAGTHPAVSARVSALTRRAVAPNPGPFTYTGTCSYIVGNGDVAIIDPGPDNPRHVETLLASISGERLRYVLVTHTHRDHSPAARALKEATGAIIAGCAPYMPSESRSIVALTSTQPMIRPTRRISC